MRSITIGLLIGVTLGLLLSACGSKEEVGVDLEPAISESTDAVFHVVRMMASLLKERPESMGDLPGEIMTIHQGDQVTVLERTRDWCKIRHEKTGEIGWIHSTFLQMEQRSRWWSGDTEKARQTARRIYKDKDFVEQGYPILHVSIEERFHKLVFETRSDQSFPRGEAKECAQKWLPYLIGAFPGWPEHSIFLTAQERGVPYTLVLGGDQEPIFL